MRPAVSLVGRSDFVGADGGPGRPGARESGRKWGSNGLILLDLLALGFVWSFCILGRGRVAEKRRMMLRCMGLIRALTGVGGENCALWPL